MTLCWELDCKNWEHSNSLFGKRIDLGVSERKKPLFIAHRKKVKVDLMRRGSSQLARHSTYLLNEGFQKTCFMQEKSLEPKKVLEEESGFQGLDEIEECSMGVKVKILLNYAMPSKYLVAHQ